jgi:hypothetical protein
MIARIHASFSPGVVSSEAAMIRIGKSQMKKQPNVRAESECYPTTGRRTVNPTLRQSRSE